MQSTIFTEIVYILLNFFLLAKPLYGDLGMGSYLFEDLLTSNSSNEVYNKFHRPGYNDSTVNVSVFIHLESMRDISSETTLDFYLLQFWQDPRLIPKTGPLKITGGDLPDSIWYPDTYFQLVRSQIYSLEEQYLVVDKHGNIEYNRKVRLTTPCSPDVMLFPFDIVTCSLMLSSFGYTADEVFYAWKGREQEVLNGSSQLGEGEEQLSGQGVHIDEKNNNVDHLGFYLQRAYTKHHKVPYGAFNYSTLETVFLLQRKYSAYLMQVYLPAGLIVMLSWTIFWINVAATPARASLGVTTVLTMLTLATQSTAQNEKHVNRKLTAIDFYLWACFLFVIFAMLEFALSDYGTFRSNNPSPPGGKGGGVSRGGGPKEVKIAKKPVHVNFNALKQDTAITSAPKCKQVLQIDKEEIVYCQLDQNQNGGQHSLLSHRTPLVSHPSVGHPDPPFNNPHPTHISLNSNIAKIPPPNQNKSYEDDHHNTVVTSHSSSSSKHHQCFFIHLILKHLHKLNQWARWAFPLGFLVFNVIYWTVLLYMAKTKSYP